MADSRDWIIFKDDHIECKLCGAIVPFGIISVSRHWKECAGKETMDKLEKIADMPLRTADKMDLIRKELGMEEKLKAN